MAECSLESVRIGFVYPAELSRCPRHNRAASREFSVPRRLSRIGNEINRQTVNLVNEPNSRQGT